MQIIVKVFQSMQIENKETWGTLFCKQTPGCGLFGLGGWQESLSCGSRETEKAVPEAAVCCPHLSQSWGALKLTADYSQWVPLLELFSMRASNSSSYLFPWGNPKPGLVSRYRLALASGQDNSAKPSNSRPPIGSEEAFLACVLLRNTSLCPALLSSLGHQISLSEPVSQGNNLRQIPKLPSLNTVH